MSSIWEIAENNVGPNASLEDIVAEWRRLLPGYREWRKDKRAVAQIDADNYNFWEHANTNAPKPLDMVDCCEAYPGRGRPTAEEAREPVQRLRAAGWTNQRIADVLDVDKRTVQRNAK